MTRLHEALRSDRTDEGFTLVEAVVSMVILALLSTGIVAGTNMITRMTADNRSRQIAVNLAERQLDIDRGIIDPFKIFAFGDGSVDPTATPAVTETISGRTYRVSQATSLVSTDGTDITCGSGKTIYYRRITVTVDWSGRLATTSPVRSDTIIAPDGRINDSSTGSIAVLVTAANGAGVPGVSVTIAAVSNGASALSTQPAATNAEGCSYALGVTPGTYKVTISKSGYADTTLVTSPYKDASPVAGSTYPVSFSYDKPATFALTYTQGNTPTAVPAASMPTTMPVSFLTASKPYISSSSAAAPTSQQLFPYAGYDSAIAGSMVDQNGVTTCAANDPAQWSAGTWSGKTLAVGSRGTSAAAVPGGSAALTVPMGVFTVKSATALYLTAVQQSAPGQGQPGCGTPQTFSFSRLAANTTTTLALPYGTYKLYTGLTALAQTTVVGSALNTTPLSTTGFNGFANGSGLLTLDPRTSS